MVWYGRGMMMIKGRDPVKVNILSVSQSVWLFKGWGTAGNAGTKVSEEWLSLKSGCPRLQLNIWVMVAISPVTAKMSPNNTSYRGAYKI